MNEQINTQEIGLIAACLSDNFLKELYDKGRLGYISTLDMISNWSHEYYAAYYEIQKDWDSFSESDQNIYKAVCWDDFLIAWGADKLKNYLHQ